MPVNKVRRNGSYAPLSAHYYKDAALFAAGERAEVLFTRSLAFCSDVLNDGFIAEKQIPLFTVGLSALKPRIAALVLDCADEPHAVEDCAGLWHRDKVRGGYVVTAWLKWNRSKKEIIEAAQKDSDRKRPESPPDRPPSPDSERNPDGNETESERPPNGFQPRARTPSPTPRHSRSTSLQVSGRTPSGAVRPETPGGTPPPARRRAADALARPPEPHDDGAPDGQAARAQIAQLLSGRRKADTRHFRAGTAPVGDPNPHYDPDAAARLRELAEVEPPEGAATA